jgi:hypothetical protein
MRIALQHKKTGLYFQDVEKWTPKSKEAFVFLSSNEAMEFCTLNRVDDHQLVFIFDEERFEIVPPQPSLVCNQALARG